MAELDGQGQPDVAEADDAGPSRTRGESVEQSLGVGLTKAGADMR